MINKYNQSDGHGPIGHEISKLLKERLPVFLNSEIDKRYVQNGSTALKKIVEETFLEMNDEIFLEMTIDCEFRYINNHPSGSTCCSLIYTPEKLICANVGDSRCIIGRQVNDEWNIIQEIKEWNFTKEDKFIIIASDGIWEFINNQEVSLKDNLLSV